MKIRFLPSVALALVALALSSCYALTATAQTSAPLENVTWTLVEYNGQTFRSQDNSYTIVFNKDNTVGGVADCNSFMGTYIASSTRIKITNQALTRAMCQNDRMEQSYIEMLQDGDSYYITGNKLYLKDGSKLVGVFEAMNYVAPKPAPATTTVIVVDKTKQEIKQQAKQDIKDTKVIQQQIIQETKDAAKQEIQQIKDSNYRR